jgi:archaellum biogenesis protein FlaJ (TadC family)
MGFTIAAYILLALSGFWLGWRARVMPSDPLRQQGEIADPDVGHGLRVVHLTLGAAIIFLVLFLLAIGLVGTLGHFGSLIQSPHFVAGLTVVGLTIAAAITGLRISPERPYSRAIHRTIDVALCVALVIVTYTGWEVVQKYLPPN